MTDSPLISVVIPLYNTGQYIDRCLRSILAQTYSNWEAIVVDDGSTDDSLAIAQRVAAESEGRIRCYRHPDGKNHGPAATRNVALSKARGEFIAFQDSDDEWLPEKLERQAASAALHPEAGMFYSRAAYIDEQGKPFKLNGTVEFGRGIPGKSVKLFRTILRENICPGHTVMIRRGCFEDVGVFHIETQPIIEDWLMWLKVSSQYRVFFLPEVLALYRIHEKSGSHQLRNSLQFFDAELNVILDFFAFYRDREGRTAEYRMALLESACRHVLRSRAWDIPMPRIRRSVLKLRRCFPELSFAFRVLPLLAWFLHPRLAYLGRRIRRRSIGL